MEEGKKAIRRNQYSKNRKGAHLQAECWRHRQWRSAGSRESSWGPSMFIDICDGIMEPGQRFFFSCANKTFFFAFCGILKLGVGTPKCQKKQRYRGKKKCRVEIRGSKSACFFLTSIDQSSLVVSC